MPLWVLLREFFDYYPVIPGISEPTYTDKQLKQMNAEENKPTEYNGKQYTKYEALQRQHKLETTMRVQKQKAKLLEEGGASEDDILNAQARYRGTSHEYCLFSKAMDLPQQRQRVYAGIIDKSGKSGIMRAEKELSPRKSSGKSFSTDWNKTQTSEYSDKFKKLSADDKVSSAVETRAKWALNNRDGVQTEEIYAVNMKNGEEIGRITDQNYSSAIKRTPLFNSKLENADNLGDEILLIHNHPLGLPPSISDINALIGNKNISGITVGHNGSVYKYTRPNKEISEDDWNIAMKHFKKYSDVTAMEKSLEVLGKKYGFSVEKL